MMTKTKNYKLNKKMKKVDLTQNMSITFTKTKHTQFLHNCRYILGIKGV